MNSLIERLMKEGIQSSPFENWADQNRCEAIAYVSEHFNACPVGELGQLIAEQAMDAHRVKVKQEPAAHSCDEAFASDAWVRGTAEVNSFMGFDYDEVEQAFHAVMPAKVISLRGHLAMQPRVKNHRKVSLGLLTAIHRNRVGLVQPEFGRSGKE